MDEKFVNTFKQKMISIFDLILNDKTTTYFTIEIAKFTREKLILLRDMIDSYEWEEDEWEDDVASTTYIRKMSKEERENYEKNHPSEGLQAAYNNGENVKEFILEE
jgi:hypothetical protein